MQRKLKIIVVKISTMSYYNGKMGKVEEGDFICIKSPFFITKILTYREKII